MREVTKDKKGITLMSLVIYITIMFVVLAIIMRVTIYFSKNIRDAADTTFETEFEKFNLYMIEETHKVGNEVISWSENSITFSDNKSFTYIDEDRDGMGEIYYNNIKLCEGFPECQFSFANNTINISVVKDNTLFKEIKYTLLEKNSHTDNVAEETYIIKKESEDIQIQSEHEE